MESKNESVGMSRPLANYHPNVWGDRFLVYTPDPCTGGEKDLVEKLKEEVKGELNEASNDVVRLLKLVDAIQRLGIEYHFEEEIHPALSHIFLHFCNDEHDYDLYTTTLAFHLLRQHGYTISSRMLDKFKDAEEGGLKAPQDIMGILEYFEATHLRVKGEDILDDGYVSSRKLLESALPCLSNPIAEQVDHALHQHSNRRGLTRVEARHYISIYAQYASHHPKLLALAKLDFNLLQAMHKHELSDLSRWWKDLEVPTKLFYARDRMVESYFWILGVYFEPKFAKARNFLTKILAISSIIDDTFDAYATFDELQLFMVAMEGWSLSCLDKLPDYMKDFYKALLETFQEIEEYMIKEGTSYRLSYGIEAMKVIARNYFAEVKWREEKYKPTSEEYMQIATASCAYTSMIICSFLGMGDSVTKEAFDFVLSKPDIVKAALIICRLTDDIVGHEFERKREHIPSIVECYTEEHNTSKTEAVYEFQKRIEAAWKDINEAFLKPTKIPTPPLYRILNFTRIIEVIYSKGDWYTHVGPEMQSFITQLLIEPVPSN
ncbi:bicyclogermacrene synthase-like [Salvia miltiorrhiza]|uniref:bicyclogermacrene synthase-like n=1 Tax=Salvia miltiorrhiza TaxID=226208 RepID=UPI0025AD0454|nr:bicyclogermacrene synthase-like [Salvia miltiorrhiza]